MQDIKLGRSHACGRQGAGVFERIFEALAREGADLSMLMIDTNHIKAHRIAANGVKKQQSGASHRQDQGRLEFQTASGMRWSGPPCPSAPDGGLPGRPACCRQTRNGLLKVEATACIPPRKKRKAQFEYDTELYKTRNIIARIFNRIKDWRQLSLRIFRCPETFLAAIVIWFL